MNTSVIRAVRRTRKMHGALGGDDMQKKEELRKEISTSIMLVGVVFIFILCNILAGVQNVIEVLGGHTGSPFFSKLTEITNLLVVINASANIAVYCIFSEKYRLLLKYLLVCDYCKQGGSDVLVPLTMSTHA